MSPPDPTPNPDLSLAEKLLAAGRLPSSRLGKRFIGLLASPLAAGAVRKVPSGAGHAYEVANPGAFRAFLDAELSRKTKGYSASTPGARNLLRSRNTKAGSRAGQVQGLFVRTLVPSQYGFGKFSGDLFDQVSLGGGVTGFRLAADTMREFHIEAPLTLVENPEVFWGWEVFEPNHERTLVLKGGVAPRTLLQWLAQASMRSCPVELAVDWDPVGLSEYRRFRDALGADRITLYRPLHLTELFQDFNKPELLEDEKSLSLLSQLRLDSDPTIQEIISLMDRHHAGLEHEALLLIRPRE
jgi:hypothetical protein